MLKIINRCLNILILMAFAFTPLNVTIPSEASAPAAAPDIEFAPDRLLARLQEGMTLDEVGLNSLGILSARQLFRGQSLPTTLAQIVLLELLPGSDVKEMAETLSQDTRFVWVEPDYLANPTSELGDPDVTPNDPLYPDQWGLAKIEAAAAWDVEIGSETVVIAIVDSGIDRTHLDLQGRLWVNPGEVAGNGLDDDNNGLIDDVHGWDFVSEDNDPMDDNGHGTQVAGVAVATTNNGAGIAGTCWGCRLMSVKVMSAGGVANYSDIAQGVLYAAQKGAEVINLSLGGYSFSNALKEAVQGAVNGYGVVVVAGAGNDNNSNPFYPAAYDEAIAVAGTDQSDLKASFSDYGAWVDLSAPAVEIQTTFSGGDYGPVDGTSMAAPFVSGLAGLLFSEHPDWSGALISAQMIHTAEPLDALNPGFEGLLGSGRINAADALTITPHPLLEVTKKLVDGDPLGRPTPGESATLEITLANDWLDAQAVQGVLNTSDPYVTVTQDTAQFGDLPAGGSGTGTPAYSFDVAVGAGYDHTINFTLDVSAYGGYSDTLDFTIKTQSAEEQVWGTIGEDTVWTNDKTYIVMGNVGVAPGITLTVEAGTDVLFNGDYSLNVGGMLLADGTEEQPIRFLSNTGGDWGRIYFDDTSIDATADMSGTYQSGNILRWVIVEGASEGIGCNYATPYLSHLTTDGGGMNCITGLSSTWFVDSDLIDDNAGGDVNIQPGTLSPNWTSRSPMQYARAYFGAAATANGKIYAIGGWLEYDISNHVEEYDIASNVWSSRANMPTARGSFAAITAANGKIYAIGGHGFNSEILNTVEEYDPQTDSWTTRSSMPTARYGLGAVLASNGKIYAVGGVGNAGTLDTVEEYDPQTDSWTTRTSMSAPRYGFGMAATNNGKIYAIGGGYNSLLDTVEEYDPQTDTWTTKSSMPTPRELLGVAADQNGKIYAIGGNSGSGEDVSISEKYDPLTDTWTYASPMPHARDGLQVVTASNDMIYSLGGFDANSLMPVNDAIEFNPLGDAIYVHVRHVQIQGGYLMLPDFSEVLDVNIGGGILIDGSGSVINGNAGIVSLISGLVQNVDTEGITLQNGFVLSNTISGGGITAGDGTIIRGNNIEDSPTWGIQSSGDVTIQGNRLVGNAAGIKASAGFIQGNLVANGSGVGLEINGDMSVISNTFTANAGAAIVIQSGAPTIQGNNLEGNTGSYDIQNLTANDIPASGNWWGTTQAYPISLRIYDYDDDYNYGEVLYQPVADGPIQDAPAYVRSVTVDPNPVGIETATFEVEFSKPMDLETAPLLSFQSQLDNTWTVFNTSNSELPANNVYSSASDADGSLWFGTEGGGVAKFDGTIWTIYDPTNSGLPQDFVKAIASDPDGSHWFGTHFAGVAKFDGTNWTVYNSLNSGLPHDVVQAIANDPDGSHWFGTNEGGVAKFDGTTWTVYNSANSGLPANDVSSIVIDPDGSLWVGTVGSGVAYFDGVTWTVYNESNSGLPHGIVYTIARDEDGSHWFGTWFGVAHFDGITWTAYHTGNSGLPDNEVHAITRDTDGSHWFGTINGVARYDGKTWTVYKTDNSGLPSNAVYTIVSDPDGTHWFGTVFGGVGVLWNYPPYNVQDNPQWLDETHFQASIDITSLISRSDYRITVANATGTDGIPIAPNTASTFTVDYAGGVGDTTAPGLPSVTACAGATLDSLSASWTASDPDSEITLYQYAIGTTPGGSDVINWTFTDQTSFDLSGLTLTPGQLYYISVKARNAGGLWSEAATPEGVLPGSGFCTTNLYSAYLSLVSK